MLNLSLRQVQLCHCKTCGHTFESSELITNKNGTHHCPNCKQIYEPDLNKTFPLKAFEINNKRSYIIVFHETRGKAKAWAIENIFYFDENTFLDLFARRVPKADEHAPLNPGWLLRCEHAKIYKELGYACKDKVPCDFEDCPLYHWS